MTKLLGANWKTTLWGIIFAVSSAVAASPAIVAFLPDDLEGYVRGMCGLIVAASGVGLAINVKDKNVTGGIVQQTSDGSVAAVHSESTSVQETRGAPPKP